MNEHPSCITAATANRKQSLALPLAFSPCDVRLPNIAACGLIDTDVTSATECAWPRS